MGRAGKTGYLPTLDGWRAIAIFAVLLDHQVEYSPLASYPRLIAFAHTGPNGVSLFFAISGFLICSRLLEEREAYGCISLRGFYVRRACRILPPAFLYLAALVALSSFGLILVSSRELWSSLLFSRNYLSDQWIHRGWGGYTIHYWSLAVEEHFYLLWPAALVLFGKRRARWFALGLACSVALWRTLDSHYHWFNRVIPGLLFGCRTDVRLDALLLGCLAALVLEDPRVRAAFSRLTSWAWWMLVAGYVAFQAFYFVQGSRTYSIFESALLAVIVAGTVYGDRTWVYAFLEREPMKWIGRLSYSLYLWQQLFLLPQARSSMAVLQQFPLGLMMLFLCAWLSYRFVERPFIRLGHRWAPPPTQGRDDLAREVVVGCLPAAVDRSRELIAS